VVTTAGTAKTAEPIEMLGWDGPRERRIPRRSGYFPGKGTVFGVCVLAAVQPFVGMLWPLVTIIIIIINNIDEIDLT